MKQKFNLLLFQIFQKRYYYIFALIIFLLLASFFVACPDNNKNDKNTSKKEVVKISAIWTHNYGVIKPIDVYIITSGYITNGVEKVEATTLEQYFISYFAETKKTISFSSVGMDVSGIKWDIVNWKTLYKDWEYVDFRKTLQYSYTIPIELVENANSYRITYYNIPANKEICFSGSVEEEFSRYKRIKEFPRSEIISIDYIF